MMDFWGAPNFDNLYQKFITGSTGGKIFIMKKFKSGDTSLGKGATVLLEKANGFLLSVLQEQYLKDSSYMIGDIELLFKLADENDQTLMDYYNQERIKNVIKAPKRQRQLYAILRKHKSLKPIRFSIDIRKKEEN
jgi:hypothetical protein